MYRALILDDEALVLKHLEAFIKWEDYGFSVVASFKSAKEAVYYIDNNPVDLVVSDIKMPDMDGIDLAKYISENYPDIKMVFMSAYREFEYAREALKYGVADYITKPITKKELVDSLTKIALTLPKTELHIVVPLTEHESIATAIAFIESEYANISSLEEVAKHVNLSPVYFGALFKQEVKENMNTYLNKVRIEKAKGILRNENAKVHNVGEVVGFKSPPYFYKTFKLFTGMTPAQYKERIKKEKF